MTKAIYYQGSILPRLYITMAIYYHGYILPELVMLLAYTPKPTLCSHSFTRWFVQTITSVLVSLDSTLLLQEYQLINKISKLKNMLTH